MHNYKLEIKWGVLFTLITLLWILFERMMGWHSANIEEHASGSLFFALPAIAVYIAALLDKRKNEFDGVMTWKQGLMTGFYVTVVVVLLNPVAQVLIHTVLSPDYLQNMADYSVASGNMEREDAEAYFSLTNYIIQGIVGAFFMGVVTSALVAVFTRKKPA